VATVVVGARREKSRRNMATAPSKEDRGIAAIVVSW
jgi:hypothetical protein